MEKIRIVLVSLFCIVLFHSCSEETYDPNPGEADKVWVKNIRMTVEGEVYYGKMNEITKQIHFPMLDKEIDLSSVRFRGNFPDDNAHFEHESYDFTMEPGNPQITKVIKVVNNKRYRNYNVTLRLKLPPPGGDFAKMKKYDFGSSGAKYPDFGSIAARIADMDMEHVLVVGRNNAAGAPKPHLLSLEDLKAGNFVPIELNLEGATGGTYMYNNGRLINGHAYVCNLSTAFNSTSPFRLYHWSTSRPDEPPVLVTNFIGADAEGELYSRHGDMLSLDLNARGTGFLYAKAGNDGTVGRQPGLLRIRIENYVNASSPTGVVVKNATGANVDLGYFATYTPVDGVTDEFMYAGDQGATYLVDGGGKMIYQMTSFGNADGQAARIINFNGIRYLIVMNAPLAGGVIAMYQLDSKVETTKEALELFDKADAGDKVNLLNPVVAIGSATSGEHVVNIGYAKNDDLLYIIGSGVGAGFCIVEIPKPAEPDPNDDSDEFFDSLDDLGFN